MGSSTNEKKTITIRYADYVEAHHMQMLTSSFDYSESVMSLSPYSTNPDLMLAYAMSFSGVLSLFDNCEKFLLDLEINTIWNKWIVRLTNETTNDLTNALDVEFEDGKYLDEINKYNLSMRNIGAVNSSSYIIGKARIENKKIKLINKNDSEEIYKLLPETLLGFKQDLNNAVDIVREQAKLLKKYFITSVQVQNFNTKRNVDDLLWPFKVLDYNGKALSTLLGMKVIEKESEAKKRSALSKVFLVASYTVNGATTGFYIGGPWGALIGAVIGVVVGIAVMLLER